MFIKKAWGCENVLKKEAEAEAEKEEEKFF